jgi:hypothetical protein
VVPDATVEEGELLCTGALPVMKVRDLNTNTMLAPDWTCYATTSVDGGVPADSGARGLHAVAATFRLGPLPAALFAGVSVDFFFGPSTLGSPAVTRKLDSESVMLDIPGGSTMLSARVQALPNQNPALSLAEVREYGFPIPTTAAPIEGYVVLQASRTLMVSLARDGGAEDPTKALIVAFARDCNGRDLSGAQFELVDGETNVPVSTGVAPGIASSSYFQYALPTPACMYTTADQPAWLMTNAPANVLNGTKTHSYRLRLKGRLTASDVAPTVLGEREVELFAGTMSLVRLYR